MASGRKTPVFFASDEDWYREVQSCEAMSTINGAKGR